MKRDFNAVIYTLEGKPFESEAAVYKRDKTGKVIEEGGQPAIEKPAVPLTLRRVALDALGSTFESDRGMGGEEKFKLYALAQRIVVASDKKEPVELNEQEIGTLKKRIGEGWGVFIAGPAYEILNTDYAVADAAQVVEDVKAETGVR
jgi:hypothetical protein